MYSDLGIHELSAIDRILEGENEPFPNKIPAKFLTHRVARFRVLPVTSLTHFEIAPTQRVSGSLCCEELVLVGLVLIATRAGAGV